MIINQQYINYFYCLLLSHSPTPLLPHFPTPLLSYSPTLLLPYFHSRVGVRIELPTHSHPPNAATLEIVRDSSFIAVRGFILHSKAHMREYLSSGINTTTQTDTAPRATIIFKMPIYVPVMVTSAFRTVPFSNI